MAGVNKDTPLDGMRGQGDEQPKIETSTDLLLDSNRRGPLSMVWEPPGRAGVNIVLPFHVVEGDLDDPPRIEKPPEMRTVADQLRFARENMDTKMWATCECDESKQAHNLHNSPDGAQEVSQIAMLHVHIDACQAFARMHAGQISRCICFAHFEKCEECMHP